MYIDEKLYAEIKNKLPLLCVDILLFHNSQFLLIKRNNSPALGQWWFPGGRIHKGESIFDAAKRKCKEELGIEIIPRYIVSVEETIFDLKNDIVDVHTVNIVVRAKLLEDNFIVNIDKLHSEFRWFDNVEPHFHDAVKNPLIRLGYKRKDE